MVDQVGREPGGRSRAKAGGEDREVAELGIEGLAVIAERGLPADFDLVALEAGLTEGAVAVVVGIGVAAAESVAQDEVRRERGVEVVRAEQVDAVPAQIAAILPSADMGSVQPVAQAPADRAGGLEAKEDRLVARGPVAHDPVGAQAYVPAQLVGRVEDVVVGPFDLVRVE